MDPLQYFWTLPFSEREKIRRIAERLQSEAEDDADDEAVIGDVDSFLPQATREHFGGSEPWAGQAVLTPQQQIQAAVAADQGVSPFAAFTKDAAEEGIGTELARFAAAQKADPAGVAARVAALQEAPGAQTPFIPYTNLEPTDPGLETGAKPSPHFGRPPDDTTEPFSGTPISPFYKHGEAAFDTSAQMEKARKWALENHWGGEIEGIPVGTVGKWEDKELPDDWQKLITTKDPITGELAIPQNVAAFWYIKALEKRDREVGDERSAALNEAATWLKQYNNLTGEKQHTDAGLALATKHNEAKKKAEEITIRWQRGKSALNNASAIFEGAVSSGALDRNKLLESYGSLVPGTATTTSPTGQQVKTAGETSKKDYLLEQDLWTEAGDVDGATVSGQQQGETAGGQQEATVYGEGDLDKAIRDANTAMTGGVTPETLRQMSYEMQDPFTAFSRMGLTGELIGGPEGQRVSTTDVSPLAQMALTNLFRTQLEPGYALALAQAAQTGQTPGFAAEQAYPTFESFARGRMQDPGRMTAEDLKARRGDVISALMDDTAVTDPYRNALMGYFEATGGIEDPRNQRLLNVLNAPTLSAISPLYRGAARDRMADALRRQMLMQPERKLLSFYTGDRFATKDPSAASPGFAELFADPNANM